MNVRKINVKTVSSWEFLNVLFVQHKKRGECVPAAPEVVDIG